jgi:hypothetical protein
MMDRLVMAAGELELEMNLKEPTPTAILFPKNGSIKIYLFKFLSITHKYPCISVNNEFFFNCSVYRTIISIKI